MMKPIMLSVYGAETVCASCVNMPTAKDTYEWLEAALKENIRISLLRCNTSIFMSRLTMNR